MDLLWTLCKDHKSPVTSVVNQYMVSYQRRSSKLAVKVEVQTIAEELIDKNKEIHEDKALLGKKKVFLSFFFSFFFFCVFFFFLCFFFLTLNILPL